MYDHIGIKVGNLDAAVRFYTAALAPLGYVLCSKDANGAGFGPKGEPALWLYLHKGLNNSGAHIPHTRVQTRVWQWCRYVTRSWVTSDPC